MKTILVINNNTPEAKHAAMFALLLAKRAQANVIIANNYIKSARVVEKMLAGSDIHVVSTQLENEDLKHYLKSLDPLEATFMPEISEIDIADMDATRLAEVINKNQVWMMVKGMPENIPSENLEKKLNVHSVLNKVLCPLLLVPANWQLKDIERLVYIADLRYCRLQVVKYLADLAKPSHASLSIAHISAKGLPDMVDNYALQVFSDEVCSNVRYDQLFFNNIREKDLKKAVDVLVNGMHNDILVMVNHRFHFEEILGRYITESLPEHIYTPLLIFPY